MGFTATFESESGATKAAAATLLLEYWSSLGFAVHSHALNEVVLRVNGYGKLGRWLEDQALEAGVKVEWHQMPIQLTVRFLAKPTGTKYTFAFLLADRWSSGGDEELQGFLKAMRAWIDGFLEFVASWVAA